MKTVQFDFKGVQIDVKMVYSELNQESEFRAQAAVDTTSNCTTTRSILKNFAKNEEDSLPRLAYDEAR